MTEENEIKKDEVVEVPEKFKKLVDEIEKMPVLELNELVKVLEKKFGVSASAVAVTTPGNGGVGEEVEERDSFTVELKSVGENKIAVIKAVKSILNLGLAEAKGLIDNAPSVLKEGVKKIEAEEMKKVIEETGAKVELK
ncbi:50S ribosomal protein L7/L12 [Patescibacteria group bacterium]|nr:50S ribosomal protein L7/L12 [Patescibacteria group bacterium]MBU4057656.1 50S ribosomal protein L7/L12 [Patescibacteria group bacterium]MBU4115944.1 50S ribosomal protein L7/L12 [Patescibacteria group bacterium]